MREAISRLIDQHHAAFAVELLGQDAAGMSPSEVEALLASGQVDLAKLGGFQLPGMVNPCDPFLFARMVARVMADAPPGQREAMRSWTLAQWTPVVDAAISEAATQGALPLGGAVSIPKPSPDGFTSTADVSAAYRAGVYARGLGNQIGAELDRALAEVWDTEGIVTEVQPDVRAETMRQIEDAVTSGPGLDPDAVADSLARSTERWAHNWQRIAETELQGAYNDGALIDAVGAYGAAAQVARIPETTACDACRDLFTANGEPIVWPVAEILANGTNAGRQRADWQATLWPMHPRCRCDTVAVPPGMFVTASGRLRKRRGMEDD